MRKRVGETSGGKDGRWEWASQREADRQRGEDGCCRETAVLAESWLMLPSELAGRGGEYERAAKPPCWNISASTHYPYTHSILWSCSDTLFFVVNLHRVGPFSQPWEEPRGTLMTHIHTLGGQTTNPQTKSFTPFWHPAADRLFVYTISSAVS